MTAALASKKAKTGDATPALFDMVFLAGTPAGDAAAHAALNAAGAVINPATAEGVAAIVTALGFLATDAKLEAVRALLASPALASGAATEATLLAIKSLLASQVEFANLIVTDGTGYFVRRETVNEATGAITVNFTTLAGAAASPNTAALTPVTASGGGGGNTRTVETALFDVTAGGTGTSVGDVIARVLVYDTAANSIVASYWHNMSTGAALASAPAAGSIVAQPRNLALGAAKDATLVSILTALGALATEAGLEAALATGFASVVAKNEAVRALLAGTLTAVLSAGEAHIGEIGSAGAHPSATPTATALTYTAGKCIGGLNDLAGFLRVAGRGAMIQSATLRSRVAQSVQIDLIIFRDVPSDTSGLADGVTFNVVPSDIGKVSKVVKFTSWDSVGTACLNTVDGVGKYMTLASGTAAKCILVARGAVTLATAADLVASLGLIQD